MSGPSPRRAYVTYRTLSALLSALPGAPTRALAARAGEFYGRHSPARRSAVKENLSRVLPDADDATLEGLVDEVFSNYGRYWADVARLTPRRVQRAVEGFIAPVEFEDLVREHTGGAILALPHVGIWELGAAFCAWKGMPLTSVAEPSISPKLDRFFERRRAALGVRTVPLDERAFSNLVAALRDGEVVALVADRDINHDGVEVELFGARTTLPAGPAALALRSGARLIPCVIIRRPGGLTETVLLPPLDTRRQGRFREDLERVTTDLARSFERLIAMAPEQWLVLYRLWPAGGDDEARP